MDAPPSRPFGFDNPDDPARFRDLLRAADYSPKAIIRILGTDDLWKMRHRSRPLFLARTGALGPLETLIRLFLLRVPVEPAVLEEAIRPMTIESWLGAGLVLSEGPALHAAVEMITHGGLVVLSDRNYIEQQPTDFVVGLGQTTRALAAMMIRKPSRLTMDLGTGCGILALLAAPFSERVIATDINPRALDFARLNAAANGITNIDFVRGGLFDPVKDHKFDLIVSNPPFVISPKSKFMYRDSGMRADGLVEAVVRGAASHLAEGGHAQVLCNWAHVKGIDWKQRVGSWLDESGCDALVLSQKLRAAAEYAMLWIDETEHGNSQQRYEAFQEWLSLFREIGMEAAENGMITLRKQSGRANWFHTDTAPEEPGAGAGSHVLQMFESRDYLASLDGDESLLEQRLQPSPAMHIKRDMACRDGSWKAVKTDLRLDTGLSYGGEIESGVEAFLITCDGRRTLREQVTQTAQATGRSPAEMKTMVLALARHLLERGFLVPPEPAERLSSVESTRLKSDHV